MKERDVASISRRALKHATLRLLVAALSLIPACAQQQQSTDLTDKSIEDLMTIEVTSASRKSESLAQAPAAIFVITRADIRRGGFSSVPEALRTVPGMYVTQLGAHIWLVSARGFSDFFNAKMLVLIDGRIVYSPLFGGVFWDVQAPPLEDIDRIEVIRGPGGTLWGANAVNGVINIMTKEARRTQGPLVSTTAGVNEGYAARGRYGGKEGEKLVYRIYGTGNYWFPSVTANGADDDDRWNLSQGGIRVDWYATQKDAVTFDGEGYSGQVRDRVFNLSPDAPPMFVGSASTVKGGHVLGRWQRSANKRSATDVLGYCDWTTQTFLLEYADMNICDFEFQHNYSFTERQSLNWGGSIFTSNGSLPPNFLQSAPINRTVTYAGFLQYDVMVVPDKFRVIVGSKFEHNNVTGFEYQPQIRATWIPKESQTVWAAVSRAVRTPTLTENNATFRFAQLSPAPPTFLLVAGDPTAGSEVLHAYELGYRYDWKQKFSLDAALFL